MAQKNFWQDKWQKDQYNQRNPGQANHPDSQRRQQQPPAPGPAQKPSPDVKKK